MNAIKSTAVALAVTATLTTSTLHAETFTGRINGHGCAHAGSTCPIDRLDPHIALERDFVLQKRDGDYFFLTNLPRDIKVRHALKAARVTGELDDRYKTLIVDELEIDEHGTYKTVWTQRAQSLEWSYFQGTGGLGPIIGGPPANTHR